MCVRKMMFGSLIHEFLPKNICIRILWDVCVYELETHILRESGLLKYLKWFVISVFRYTLFWYNVNVYYYSNVNLGDGAYP
jgi:hypothetical protein